MFIKSVFLFSLFITVFGNPIEILSQKSDLSPDGTFEWSYQSADGTSQQQSGQLKQIGKQAGEVIQGSASWTDPEGGKHELTYVADENGYQPQSADIPVPPPIPASILRSLQWIATHPQTLPKL